jgi:hypothetical protein
MKVLLHTLGWAGLLTIAPTALTHLPAWADESPTIPEPSAVEPSWVESANEPAESALDLEPATDSSALGEANLTPEASLADGDHRTTLEAIEIRLGSEETSETTAAEASGSDPAELSPDPIEAADAESPAADVEATDPDAAPVEAIIPTADLLMELAPAESPMVPADGRSTVALAGAITDGAGNPLDYDVVVTLTTTAGQFVEADYDRDRSGFQVLARRGQFQVTLQAGLTAQAVEIRAWADGNAARDQEPTLTADPPPDLEATTAVNFVTHLRPSLVSGYVDFRVGAGGTDFWGSFSEFLNPDLIGRTEWDLDAGLFATGTFGQWQFTGALNTERALNQTCEGNRLFRDTQFCDQSYPVYGDSSTTDFLTPSIDSLYLRFQRDSLAPDADPDYFMWGDYATQEFAGNSQQFTATVRELHGFKGNYTFANGIQLTALYADNVRPFQRDTIAPDGTSGYYFLSRRLVLRGSENVFIEAQEFNRPGTVLERTPLYRGVDYEIDYDRGTLLFRQPILATAADPFGQTLVRRIVATYQVDGVGVGGNLYAARLQYNLEPGTDTAGWAGFSVLLEDQGIQQFRLAGVDAQIPLGENGRLTAELATSSLNVTGQEVSGSAYRFEALGTILPGIVGSAYLSSASSGFSNTATTSFRPGQTRYGASLTANFSPTTQVTVQFDREENVGVAPQVSTSAAALLIPGQYTTPGSAVDNTLTTFQIGVEQRFGDATVGLGFVNRSRRDRILGIDTSAQQLVPSLRVPLAPTLEFLAQSELNFGSDVDALYPTRTSLGLQWDVEPGVSVRLTQQFISGGLQPRSVTSLDTIADYALGDNTSLTSRYSLISGYGGLIGQSALGLNHRIVLAPGLRVNLGFERILNDAFTTTGAGQQFAQPYAVGNLGATALGLQSGTSYSVGLEYTDNPNFQASARIEHRDSLAGDNTVLTAAAAGRVSPSLTTLFRYQQANYANQTITGRLGNSSSLKLGLAYRNPSNDIFNGLLSYEYRRNPSTTPTSLLIDSAIGSTDHTFAFEGIYAPNWQWEFYTKYAFRVNNATLAEDFSYSSTIQLAQFRATYRFAYRWDVLGEVRWITQPSAGYSETGLALELGYYLSPDLRLGLGYSFGSVNSDGFGGSGYRSAGGLYFGVQIKVNELLEGFGLQTATPAQQSESYVDPLTDFPSPDVNLPEPLPPTQPATAPPTPESVQPPPAPEPIESPPVDVPAPTSPPAEDGLIEPLPTEAEVTR